MSSVNHTNLLSVFETFSETVSQNATFLSWNAIIVHNSFINDLEPRNQCLQYWRREQIRFIYDTHSSSF